ncbi:hypothetical protein [Methyloglobulus sp.]|uniref:hypothetical protein n=1 Tax=Methyloglobulus sp. TaxID=2518622 RepID=UPI0032B7CD9C
MPELQAKLYELETAYKDYGGGNEKVNSGASGHKTRIEIIEAKLKWFEDECKTPNCL